MYFDYPTFARLYSEVADYTDVDMYIAERGWQDWMDNFSDEDIPKILQAIYDIGKMSMADIRSAIGYSSRAEMHRKYRIPLRTLESWDAGDKEPRSAYVFALIAYTLFVAELNKREQENGTEE